MKSAEYVEKKLNQFLEACGDLVEVAWKIALMCVGWAYVFGAKGGYCTPKSRKAAYNSHKDHETIKTKCQVLRDENKKPDCEGCKWFPGGKRTRDFDCRGFTYWILKVVFGFELQGAGATSQWATASNWKAKGKIKTIPEDTLVCLFQHNSKTGKMAHTGLGYKGETVECQVGVQHFTKRSSKWTHWAIPACVDSNYVLPKEEPQKEEKPVKKYQTIKKGNHGETVKKCQQMLEKLGYNLGVCGVDSDFGIATEKAVREFQKDHGLKVDGIVGEKTWEALEKAVDAPPAEKLYTVKITGQKKAVAEQIVKQYGGTMTAEK